MENLYYNFPKVCLSDCLSVFANCRSQFLLDLLGRCLKLSVSAENISCHEFAFQFGLAILFIREKHQNSRGNRVGSACIYFNDPAMLPAMNASGAVGHGCSQMNGANLYGGGDGGVCVCVRSRMRVRACVDMRACVMCLQYTIIIFDLG